MSGDNESGGTRVVSFRMREADLACMDELKRLLPASSRTEVLRRAIYEMRDRAWREQQPHGVDPLERLELFEKSLISLRLDVLRLKGDAG